MRDDNGHQRHRASRERADGPRSVARPRTCVDASGWRSGGSGPTRDCRFGRLLEPRASITVTSPASRPAPSRPAMRFSWPSVRSWAPTSRFGSTPRAGPRIHDRIQAPTIEALFRILDPRWHRLTEVGVNRPARGFVDAVLALPAVGLVVATEVESAIRRLEQQLRWAHDKADSLPSSAAWSLVAPADGPRPVISRLLILRSTRSTGRSPARWRRHSRPSTRPPSPRSTPR